MTEQEKKEFIEKFGEIISVPIFTYDVYEYDEDVMFITADAKKVIAYIESLISKKVEEAFEMALDLAT